MLSPQVKSPALSVTSPSRDDLNPRRSHHLSLDESAPPPSPEHHPPLLSSSMPERSVLVEIIGPARSKNFIADTDTPEVGCLVRSNSESGLVPAARTPAKSILKERTNDNERQRAPSPGRDRSVMFPDRVGEKKSTGSHELVLHLKSGSKLIDTSKNLKPSTRCVWCSVSVQGGQREFTSIALPDTLDTWVWNCKFQFILFSLNDILSIKIYNHPEREFIGLIHQWNQPVSSFISKKIPTHTITLPDNKAVIAFSAKCQASKHTTKRQESILKDIAPNKKSDKNLGGGEKAIRVSHDLTKGGSDKTRSTKPVRRPSNSSIGTSNSSSSMRMKGNSGNSKASSRQNSGSGGFANTIRNFVARIRGSKNTDPSALTTKRLSSNKKSSSTLSMESVNT
eukprot:c23277_g1_i1.p1 GENE.c23277_g1_i1~~c23277_g1_i1.p1  ORF type:complete len:395 (+),score=61.23 c23277_g1_i1:79-1263(+)